MRYTVLASGSAGNASLLETEGIGLLVDAGLGPRVLAGRLAAVEASWRKVNAVLLTHTHSDHWNEYTLGYLCRHRIPLYCHAGHGDALRSYSAAFGRLEGQELVQCYEPGQDCELPGGLRCRPLELRHDGGPTFGFRLEGAPDLFGHRWALGYAADLGCWSPALADALADVDVLALEFNHDVEMEINSRRSERLIVRVLGDDGHLSNNQAALLLQEVLRRSTPGRLRHVVQLHLSRECNRPRMAWQAATAVLAACAEPPRVHVARQDRPGPCLALGGAIPRRIQAQAPGRQRTGTSSKDCLPGLDASAVPAVISAGQ